MDWKRAIGEERALLARIVAMLLALADLAERACGRSDIVCRFVHFVLRPAETAARTLFDDLPEAPAASVASFADVRKDLMQIACTFRQLAHLLLCQAELALFGLSDDDAGPVTLLCARGRLLSGVVVIPGPARPVHVHDTS